VEAPPALSLISVRLENVRSWQMQSRRLLLTLSALLAFVCGGMSGCEFSEVPKKGAWKGPVAYRSVVLDPLFLQGNRGEARIDDITRQNVIEETILQGVFAMPPKHHVDVRHLIETGQYETFDLRPDALKSFDSHIYSDVLLRLKGNSLCRIQHSYKAKRGLWIRVVRDHLIAYIKPNNRISTNQP
jgi:hypothetical protein